MDITALFGVLGFVGCVCAGSGCSAGQSIGKQRAMDAGAAEHQNEVPEVTPAGYVIGYEESFPQVILDEDHIANGIAWRETVTVRWSPALPSTEGVELWIFGYDSYLLSHITDAEIHPDYAVFSITRAGLWTPKPPVVAGSHSFVLKAGGSWPPCLTPGPGVSEKFNLKRE